MFEVFLDTTNDAMDAIRAAVKCLKPGKELRGMRFDWYDAFRSVHIAPADIPMFALCFESTPSNGSTVQPGRFLQVCPAVEMYCSDEVRNPVSLMCEIM